MINENRKSEDKKNENENFDNDNNKWNTTKIATIIIDHNRTAELRLEQLKCHDNTISTTNIYYNVRGSVWAA